jgi:HAD superfamily hydrolase (TIGR01509 family)
VSQAEPIEAVILDVDGTLYDQHPLRIRMALRLVQHVAASPVRGLQTMRALRAYRTAQELLRAHQGQSVAGDAQLQHACAACGLPESVVREQVDRWMQREPLDLVQRYARPGLRDFLQRTRQRGVRTAVFSDYPPTGKIRALGIHDLLDVVAAAQDSGIGRFKPDPRGLLHVAEQLGVAPARAVYVGDRPEVDGVAAARAGMRCWIFTTRQATTAGDGWRVTADFASLGDVLFPR